MLKIILHFDRLKDVLGEFPEDSLKQLICEGLPLRYADFRPIPQKCKSTSDRFRVDTSVSGSV